MTVRSSDITGAQIRKIHVLKNKLNFTDDNYRANLLSFFGVESSKSLNYDQADIFIKKLEEDAVMAGVWAEDHWPYRDLDDRPGMATSRQIRKIKALWRDVSRAENSKNREKGLRTMLLRIVKVSDVRFLKINMVKKIIKAFEEMKKQKEKKERQYNTDLYQQMFLRFS